jgi:stage II sporulation protein D
MLTGAGESVRISAGPFRLAVGRALGWNTIRGDRYDVSFVAFKGTGSGHGVGLCQQGADEMGREGRSYREILSYYYPGTAVGLTAAGLAWQRLSGERLALWTVRPNQDKIVLASAQRLLAGLERQTGWSAPAGIEIRVYPDLDTYRNATGEPGSIAGYTQGHRIYLQPLQMLQSRKAFESTLAHELAHVLIGSQSRSELPLWFQEGLANYLAGLSTAKTPVGALVRCYGETAVLGWVKRSLPAEVTNASTSHPAIKSR